MFLFFNVLEFYIYLLQQKIYLFLSIESSSLELSVIFIFFVCGCLTSFNPCLMSMLPVSISYISAQNMKDFKKISFYFGLASSILFICFFIFLFKQGFQFISLFIPILSSIFIIIISLNLLQIIEFNVFFLKPNLRKISMFGMKSFIQSYFVGLLLGLSSSSCSTPILLTLFSWLFYKNNFFQAFTYLCFYIFGYILPLSLFINIVLSTNQVKIIARLWQYFIPFGGSILLGLGVFSLLDQIFI